MPSGKGLKNGFLLYDTVATTLLTAAARQVDVDAAGAHTHAAAAHAATATALATAMFAAALFLALRTGRTATVRHPLQLFGQRLRHGLALAFRQGVIHHQPPFAQLFLLGCAGRALFVDGFGQIAQLDTGALCASQRGSLQTVAAGFAVT